MTPGVRKLALTAHITSSVGWLGSVAGFLALAVAGLMSQDAQIVRASYVAIELVGWCVIVPLSVASLLTGLVQSLGTTWGLFRHYWIVAKLLITVVASILLLVHMQVASRMADVVAGTTLAAGDFRGMRIQLVADGAGAVVVLVIATALSVFKPQGLTPFGRRQLAESERESNGSAPRWVWIAGVSVGALVLLFVVIKHLTGGGLGAHH
ncbi:MAG: hypothetical protein Q8N18_26225 [Opitutaceae bacterium]|nr:hypothetical protein [Opitutaceae bacterium]